jgi:hypothetical protein
MKLGHAADEIKYDATFSTVARYVVVLDGEPTMYILCDAADPGKVIRIAAKADMDALTSDTLDLLSQATKGRFATKTKILEDAEGAPLGTETYVDRKTVYSYILPRLHVLLGRLLRAAA